MAASSVLHSGGTTANLTLLAVTTVQNGYRYRCVVTNSAGTVNSNPATLTVTAIPSIANVALTVAAPVAGATASFSATTSTANVKVVSVEWYNDTDGKDLKSGDKFEAGKKYNVTIGIEPNAGYKFIMGSESSGTKVTINGKAADGLSSSTETYIAAYQLFTVSGTTATAPVITTSSLAGGTTGTAYSQTLSATGTAPVTWDITAGSLPGGLSLNASTGVISGTPATAGTSSFTVRATNSAGSNSQA
jgi:hypothetical protein